MSSSGSALFVIFLAASVPLLLLWIEHRRRAELAAFAQAHGLSYANKDWPAGVPHPEATKSLFLGLHRCRHVVSGVYRNVLVLAFDFSVPSGRSRQRGTGVGIRGTMFPTNLPQLRRMDFEWRAPWSFLTTGLGLFGGHHRLRPEDVQRLWDLMIDHAVSIPGGPPRFQPPPGEIVIRPRR